MEVLQFIFQDFWHFIGTAILLYIILPWDLIRSCKKANKP